MAKRIVAKTQNDGWKPRKKRKPMTEEQRKATERLALARQKKTPKILPYILVFLHCLMTITYLQRKLKNGLGVIER